MLFMNMFFNVRNRQSTPYSIRRSCSQKPKHPASYTACIGEPLYRSKRMRRISHLPGMLPLNSSTSAVRIVTCQFTLCRSIPIKIASAGSQHLAFGFIYRLLLSLVWKENSTQKPDVSGPDLHHSYLRIPGGDCMLFPSQACNRRFLGQESDTNMQFGCIARKLMHYSSSEVPGRE